MVEPLLSLPSSSLDETIEERCCMKGDQYGIWAQFLQAILVSFAWFFDAQQTFISAFTDAQPSWHCTSPSSSSSYCNSFSISNNFCNLPKGTWAWNLPAQTSVISEWSLQCDGSFITGFPASSFFMGCLTGGFLLSTLGDSSVGRKNMLVLSCLLMSISGTITAFSTNIWMYSFLRFLSGCGRATIGTSALVLSTELFSTSQWQGQVGVIGYFCFTLGFLSLSAMAFINRGSSWRLLYLWTCLPAVLYSLLVHFFIRESPIWCLYVNGHKEEVINLYSAINMLVEKKWAFRRLVMVMLVGFGFGMVYYGMPLAVGNLDFNLYISNTLNALSELPASLVTFFLIGKLSRKGSLLGFAMLSGTCSIGCCIVEGENLKFLQIGLELISFFSACTATDVLLIYALELFPTCVRNSALAMVRQTLVLGGASSPMLVAVGRYNKWFSYGVFGLSIATCGFFVVCLPETKDRTLSDTMEEEESKEVTFVC